MGTATSVQHTTPRSAAPVTRERSSLRRQDGLPTLGYWARAAAITTAVAVGVIVLAFVLYRARSVGLAVFLGFFLATGFEPFLRKLEHRGLKRGYAVLTFLLGAVVLVGLFVWLALAPAVGQASELVGKVPTLVDQLSDRNSFIGRHLQDPEVQEQVQAALGKVPSFLHQSLGAVFGLLGAVLGGLFSAFTIVALMIYFMLAMPRMRAFAARALRRPERVEVMDDALGKVGGYVTGQLTVSAAAGIVAYVYLLAAGVPYAAVLAICVALLDAIPQVGATLGAFLCALVALTESTGLALLTLAVLLGYQQIENFVVAPRVFAKAVELSPAAVFVAVLAGGSLAGAIGALTALPVTAAVKVIMRYALRRQLAQIEGVEPHGEPAGPVDAVPVVAGAPAAAAGGSRAMRGGHGHASADEDPVHPHDEHG